MTFWHGWGKLHQTEPICALPLQEVNKCSWGGLDFPKDKPATWTQSWYPRFLPGCFYDMISPTYMGVFSNFWDAFYMSQLCHPWRKGETIYFTCFCHCISLQLYRFSSGCVCRLVCDVSMCVRECRGIELDMLLDDRTHYRIPYSITFHHVVLLLFCFLSLVDLGSPCLNYKYWDHEHMHKPNSCVGPGVPKSALNVHTANTVAFGWSSETTALFCQCFC